MRDYRTWWRKEISYCSNYWKKMEKRMDALNFKAFYITDGMSINSNYNDYIAEQLWAIREGLA